MALSSSASLGFCDEKEGVPCTQSVFRQFSLTGQVLWKCPIDAHTTKMLNFWLAKSPKQPQVLCPKNHLCHEATKKAQRQFHFIQLTGTAMYSQDSTYVLQLSDNFHNWPTSDGKVSPALLNLWVGSAENQPVSAQPVQTFWVATTASPVLGVALVVSYLFLNLAREWIKFTA